MSNTFPAAKFLNFHSAKGEMGERKPKPKSFASGQVRENHSQTGNIMDISGVLEHLRPHEMMLLLQVVLSLSLIWPASADIISSILYL